jgi:hypothetical protein
VTRKLTAKELATNLARREWKERRELKMRAERMRRFRRKAVVRWDSMVLWSAKTSEDRRKLQVLKPDWMVYERI